MTSYFVDKKDCTHHCIFPGVEIFTACGEQMMLSLVEMEPLAVVEEHSHPHEQITLVEKGRVLFTIEGQEREVAAGDVLHFPPGVRHGATILDEEAILIDIFSPVREDFLPRTDRDVR